MAQEVEKTGGDVTRMSPQEAPAGSGPLYRPNTDIWEDKDHVWLAIDMPGVRADAVDVSVENRTLTVRGTLETPAPEGYRRVYAEYGPGRFERAFTLPETIDNGAIEARHRDGVLHLSLKKSEAAKPKRIEVKAA